MDAEKDKNCIEKTTNENMNVDNVDDSSKPMEVCKSPLKMDKKI